MLGIKRLCLLHSCRGDHNLRSSYGSCMLSLMQQLPIVLAPGEMQAVLDLGCATGLSSLALAQLFPAAQITGVDLSPHMVAVGRYPQERRQVRAATASLLAAALGQLCSIVTRDGVLQAWVVYVGWLCAGPV
jgi:trans-aconitate methyltransferase